MSVGRHIFRIFTLQFNIRDVDSGLIHGPGTVRMDILCSLYHTTDTDSQPPIVTGKSLCH